MFNFLKSKNTGGIDFYFSNKELLLNGITEIGMSQINRASDTLKHELKVTAGISLQKSIIKEKNYGYGADWTVALIEFIANSDLLKAIATTSGIITFSKHIVGIFKKFKSKSDYKIHLGMQTARFYGIYFISEKINIENIELIHNFELNRGQMGFTDKEYLLIFGVNKHDLDVQDRYNADKSYNGIIFSVHLNWIGELKEIKQY